jgi:hypothetical protein
MIPFHIGVQVIGDDFCPRVEETGRLREVMQSFGRIYLVGERRIGKSSLIAEAARPLKKLRSVFVDLMAVKGADDLTHRFAQAMLCAERTQSRVLSLVKSLSLLRPSISFDTATGNPSVTFAPESGSRLETLDELFAALQRQKNGVVILDEFQDIQNLPDAPLILARLRNLIQQARHTGFVFCGSIRNRMEEIFTDEKSPFFNSAVRLQVGPLDRTLFQAFLSERFAEGRRTVPEPLLNSIMDACQDNPGHIQRFCVSLWQVTSYGQKIDEKEVVSAWEVLFGMQKDAYELLIAELSSQQMKVLRALAHAGGSSGVSSSFLQLTGITLAASVHKAMSRLVERRLVQKINTAYRFCDPFLAAWLRKQPM